MDNVALTASGQSGKLRSEMEARDSTHQLCVDQGDQSDHTRAGCRAATSENHNMNLDCYVFEGFRLYPSEYRLVRESGSEEIFLGRRSFELLVALVKRQGKLVKREQLLNEVWEDATVEEGNLSTQISNLRKALGDDDSSPRYIETLRGVGFRFIAPVSKEQATISPRSHSVENTIDGTTSFDVEVHRFVPVYIGPNITGCNPHATKWGNYRKLEIGDAHLYVTQFGIGVWDICDVVQFSYLTDLALWRREKFRSILEGEHSISKHTSSLLLRSGLECRDFLCSFAGKFEYVLSFFTLKNHRWPVPQLRSALKLLSCPKILLEAHGETFDHTAAINQEQILLEGDFDNPDLHEFGVFGSDFGYAGWAGVAYYGFGKASSTVAARIIQFEVALQALWLFSHLVNQELQKGPPAHRQSDLNWAATIIQRELNRLRAIGPNDPTEERMMCEALFTTSRIENHANAVLECITRYEKR